MASSYDEIAEWYDTWIGTHSMSDDPFFRPLEALIGDVAGQRICDLACGQGRVARYLAAQGAHVVGVDLSANSWRSRAGTRRPRHRALSISTPMSSVSTAQRSSLSMGSSARWR